MVHTVDVRMKLRHVSLDDWVFVSSIILCYSRGEIIGMHFGAIIKSKHSHPTYHLDRPTVNRSINRVFNIPGSTPRPIRNSTNHNNIRVPSTRLHHCTGPMAAKDHYLLFYNTSLCIGWAWVLQRLLFALKAHSPTYGAVAMPLQIFQTLAAMEVIHAAVGLVRASAMTTAVQVASRLFVLWGIVYLIPDVRTSIAFNLMVAAWSLTEVPRYFYFAFSAQGKPPRALVWLRYSTFLLLYPIGASSEFITVYLALPFIKQTALLGVSMPNAFNFSFDYWLMCCFTLLCYFPGLPYMYSHMIRQRRKYLGKARANFESKAA